MAENVERVLERGQGLDDLQSRSEHLQESVRFIDLRQISDVISDVNLLKFQSVAFNQTSTQMRRHFCVRNAKWTIVLSILLFLLLVAIVLTILYETGVFKHKSTA